MGSCNLSGTVFIRSLSFDVDPVEGQLQGIVRTKIWPSCCRFNDVRSIRSNGLTPN